MQLYEAAKAGDAAKVLQLLDQQVGFEINTEFVDGQTPLFIAAQHGHLDVVEALLGKGAKVGRAIFDGRTPLGVAAEKGHLEVVEALLRRRAVIGQTNALGHSPLSIASFWGHHLVVETLIARGAIIDQADAQGFTPLHTASAQGHLIIVEALLKRGAAVNQASVGGIFTACFCYCARVKVATYGGTPLYFSAQQGHLAVVEALLGRGADVDLALSDGRTPLFTAAHNGNLAVVEVLLRRGAAVNQADEDRRTPLFIAAQQGHLNVVEALLCRGAAIDQAYVGGATPLRIAIQRDHLAVAHRLRVITNERRFAKLGNVGRFRAVIEAGFLTAPIIQWLPLLPAAPRAELSLWVGSCLGDMRGLYATVHHGNEEGGEGHVRRIMEVPSPITELVSLYLLHPRYDSRQLLRSLAEYLFG